MECQGAQVEVLGAQFIVTLNEGISQVLATVAPNYSQHIVTHSQALKRRHTTQIDSLAIPKICREVVLVTTKTNHSLTII